MQRTIKTIIFPIALLCATLHAASAAEAPSANAPYDGTWEALQKMPVPAWFDDGKIGIFIHWGPYSAIGKRKGNAGYAEHVPKMMYRDKDYYYAYFKERWGGHPPEFGYKDVIPEFRAENWDPAQWAKLFKEVGAKYVVLTAEHHDGWANWDSELTPWNAVDKGPKRDLVGDLGAAVRAEGLKYAPSFHRERHPGFFAQEQFAVHSEPHPDIVEEIKRVPEAALLYGPDFSYSKNFVDDYVARWKEIQEKYQPDMMWLDDFPIYTRDGNNVRKGEAVPEIKYLDDQLRGMITDFMNAGAESGRELYINNKGGLPNWPEGAGCLEKDNLKMKVIGPKWQSCTTFGTSFGFLEGDRYKSVEEVIHEMVEVISRNGNFLINIGPKADGTIPEPQVERLRAMGDWLSLNGEAIYGSRYWKMNAQENEHLAFTTKGEKLYVIKLEKPEKPFIVEGTSGWEGDDLISVRLLGSEAEVAWELTSEGLEITPPKNLGKSAYAWSFEVLTTQDQHTPMSAPKSAQMALSGTKEVNLDGEETVVSEAKNGEQKRADGSWVTDTTEEWNNTQARLEGVQVEESLLSASGQEGAYRSKLMTYQEKRKATLFQVSQSTLWQNWIPTPNLGPENLGDSPIFLQLGPGNYWMFGRYEKPGRRGGSPKKHTPKAATLEGFSVPLETTPWENQYNAPGGLKPGLGGYHAWQSRDMKNWVHHGPISDSRGKWMTNAEYVEGKAYFYYDFPNDQDPHLIIDEDLTDGEAGEYHGMAFKDPSHGSDAGIIRDLEGNFHLILENWSPISANKRSWDSPLASHAVSPDGIKDFKLVEPAVDERTNPTGKKGTYRHPHWVSEDPENYKTSVAEYEIHEPEQEAYGDWAAVSIGGQYYLFGDYDPAGAHGQAAMSVCWFTADDINKKFTFCGHIGKGHPDPDIIFAEGQFYLATQMQTDYVSPGPWVESVEVRVGVDVDNDQKIDEWTEWKEVKESYDYIEGFAKQVAKTPAVLDVTSLPEGYGFQYEIKLKDTTENPSKPLLDKVELHFTNQ